jgi:transposase InsO family protein
VALTSGLGHLAINVARRLNSDDMLATLTDLFAERGPPARIRSDQGPEFIARAVRNWSGQRGVTTLYIYKASSCENGDKKSFNGKLRNELLNFEICYSLTETKLLIETWRRHYNTRHPHSSLDYRPPAPKTISPPSRSSGLAEEAKRN